MINRSKDIFTWSSVALGALICAFAALNLSYAELDVRFAVLASFTILFGSKMSLRLPRSKIFITVGEGLIFLVLIIYNGEAAILLAAAEALITSFRLKRSGEIKKTTTVLVNTALVAIATGATYTAVSAIPRVFGRAPSYDHNSELVATLGLIAIVQFLTSATLIALAVMMRSGASFWKVWNEKCFANSLTCVIGAVVAGIVYKSLVFLDFYAFVIVAAIIGLVYLTYRRYIAEIITSHEQAQQAERERAEAERRRTEEAEKHIAELSLHIAEQERTSEALRVSKERFQHAALHDALTGLPNRAFFFEQIKFLLERNKHNDNNGFCVLFMDLDGFKKINDSLGHAIGDKLLVQVARCLENTIRQGDTVARLGGDEFAIVLTEINHDKDAINFAERISRAIAQPFKLDGHQVFTQPSIGLALSNDEYETPEEILRDADIAMYDAKETRAGCSVFDRELRVRAVNTIKLETDLRYAVEQEQFRIFYQPIISLDSGFLTGFEALIRWQHPERGLISPAEFIPIAESSGQIVPMTNWILWQACSQLSRWRWRSPINRSLIISVNLSSKHFTQPDLVDTVAYTLHETGLDPRCLKLELTESAVMENAEDAARVLQSLRAIGVQLSIDDFGTGYSSLSYLHRFPIDTLKVDRSFVMRMGANGENAEIVKTIITLAQNLGLSVIAEGVETIDQLKNLRELGCSYGQGYFFAKPLPVDDIDALMRTKSNWLPDGIAQIHNQNSQHFGKVVTLPSGRLADFSK